MPVPTITVYIAWGALPSDGAPSVWYDMTSYTMSVSTRVGRQDLLDRMEAGTATIVLNNATGYFTPLNTQSIYYPGVRPLAQVKILADAEPLYYGLIERITPEWYVGGGGIVTLECTDVFRYLSFAEITNQPFTLDLITFGVEYHILYAAGAAFVEQSVGARVAAVLTSIGCPFTTDVDTTGATVAATTPSGSALEYLRELVATEQGLFWQDLNGTITYDSLDTIRALSTFRTAQADIGDGVGQIPYTAVEMSMDESLIYNEIKGKISDGTSISAQSDTDSQALYLRRTQDLGTTELTTRSQLETRALLMLIERKTAQLRASSIAFAISDSSVDAATLLGLRPMHRVDFTRTPDVGDAISGEYLVQGMEHDITPGSWTMRLRVSQSPETWRLGIDLLGIGTVV